MVKRIFKIVGIVLLGFILLTGGIVGIVALTGGFKKEEVPITSLYFEKDSAGNYIKNIQVQTLDDIVQNIKFEPANATNKELVVECVDDYNILSNEPSKINAGEDFTLKLNHDERGNNIGGFATLRFKAGIEWVDMTVFVDVAIPDKAIYFTGDMSSKITSSGKTFSMAISDNTQYVYLNSQLINSFDLKVNNENIKNVQIGYDYYYSSGQLYESKIFDKSELAPSKYINDKNGYTDSFYKIPVVTDKAGTIDIWAKMHRTAEIETEFNDSGFNNILEVIRNKGNSSVDNQQAILLLNKYNAFLNKYIKYFDTTDESYEFFQDSMINMGAVTLISEAEVEQSLNYVFVTARATIDVTAIKLDDFVSIDIQSIQRPFNVFETVSYSITGSNDSTSIVDEFGLTIYTDNEDASGVDTEKKYLFESLQVNPYIYLQAADVELVETDSEETRIKWAEKEYSTFIPVYGFENNRPVTELSGEGIAVGYLIRLVYADEDYLSISQTIVDGEKRWNVTPNVPMQYDQVTGEDIYKALYLCFEISGIDSKENINVVKKSFTRVNINYTDFEFSTAGVDNLVVDDLMPYMITNTADISINTDSDYYGKVATDRFKQNISLNTEDYVTNMDSATYTNVMYFAESKSNVRWGDAKKVVTVGNYKFLNYANVINPNSENNYYTYNGEPLQGQRIPTYTIDANGKKQYYIHALHSSDEPVKLFAVVYLSDKNGYPIDINGRKIEIDESTEGADIPELVVVRISDITDETMPAVRIDSIVENINFYTESVIDHNISEGIVFERGFLNRNHLNNYMVVDEENTASYVDETTLQEIQDFLRIKLLKNNSFTIYLTPYELDSEGKAVEENDVYEEISCTDVYGNPLSLTLSVISNLNKTQAFDNLISDLDNYALNIGGSGVSVKNEKGEVIGESTDRKIKWEIVSKRDDNSISNPIIYLDPSSSTMPFCTSLIPNASQSGNGSLAQQQKNNYVLFDTHKLDILDVVISDSIKIQNLINIKYAELINTSAKQGDLSFTRQGYTSEFELELENGNIAFDVLTNLVSGDNVEFGDVEKSNNLNLTIVDCAQATWNDGGESDFDQNKFSCLKKYIEYFVKNTNNTELKYSRTKDMMSFAEDAKFTNLLSGEYSDQYIYFGTEKIEIKTYESGGKYVEIGGYSLDLTQTLKGDIFEYSFVIEQGSYFPMINGDKALIYNTIFDINSDNQVDYYIVDYKVGQEYSGTKYYINKTATINAENSDGEIVATSYNIENYVDSNVLTITKKPNSETASVATVNFKYGEEVWVYAEDENGSYKRVKNASGVGYSYVVAEDNYDGMKYSLTNKVSRGDVDKSKMGVKVYLLVTFPIIKSSDGSGSEFEFYKAIEFELLQENINIELFDGDNLSGLASNRLSIDPGSDSNIIGFEDFNPGKPSFEISAEDEHFFEHIDVSIDTPSVKGISLEISNNNKSLTIKMPHVVIDEASFILKISYPYKGSMRTQDFYFRADPDIKIGLNEDLVDEKVVSETEKYYVISINAQEKYSVTDRIFTDYFSLKDSPQIHRVELNGLRDINAGDAYATFDGAKITYDEMIFDIVLVLNDGTTITLDHKLLVKVNPLYIIDLSSIKDKTQTIFNNENIYANLVKLYDVEGTTVQNINEHLIGNMTPYEIFTISGTDDLISDKEGDTTNAWIDSDKIKIKDGRITLLNTPSEDITLRFKISYKELNYNEENNNGYYTEELEFALTIRGVKIETTQSFDENGVMTIYIEEGDNFNVEDYIAMSVNSSDVEVYAFLSSDLRESLDNAILETNSLAAGEYTYYVGYGKFTSGQGIRFIDYLRFGTRMVAGDNGDNEEYVHYQVILRVYSKSISYSETGEADSMSTLNKNVEVTITNGEAFDISKYISASLDEYAPSEMNVAPILCSINYDGSIKEDSIVEGTISNLSTGSYSYLIAYKIINGEIVNYELTEYAFTIIVQE